jgi:hypothetical protein
MAPRAKLTSAAVNAKDLEERCARSGLDRFGQTMVISLRPALPDEAAFLSQLCLRSKASWGYTEEFMAVCRSEAILTPEIVAVR